MGQAAMIKEPDSITAPPQSSDYEDYKQENSDDDSQDSHGNDRKNQRGDIRPTIFSTLPSSQTSNVGRNTRGRSAPSSQAQRLASDSQNDEPTSSAGSKRSAENPVPETGNHLKNTYGFTKKSKTTVGGYSGSKSSQPRSQPRSSQIKSSQKSAPRSSARQRGATSQPDKKFKKFEASSSPESARSPPVKRFKKPESVSPEKTRSSRAFVEPPSSVGSSPDRDSRRPIFRPGSILSDESPEIPRFKSNATDERPKATAKTAPGLNQKSNRTGKSKRTKARRRQSSPESRPDHSSQRPAFKLHALDDLDYLDDSDGKEVDVFKNEDSDDEAGDITIESPVAITTRCPMCHEVVDAELLAKHSDHGRMNIRKQTAFCRLHKRRAALSSRSQKGYPKINWETLGTRFEKYYDFLKDILVGARRSHYRDVLEENVESGKNRTLLKTEDSLTPGYYGPRGLRAMTEYIMRMLSSVVRKRAVEDRLVSARGYTGYVQAVLVPELAVRLIMEDMSVAEEDAQKIMQDSIEVGELLHEDAGDIIASLNEEGEGQ